MLIPNAPLVGEMKDSSSTVPEATYNLRIEKAEYVAQPKSANAKGPYIKCQITITGPGEAEAVLGRKIFQNYSLTGDGSFRLRELLKVTGHEDDFQLTDDQQLVNLEFAGVVIVKDDPTYGPRNEIKRHLPLIG